MKYTIELLQLILLFLYSFLKYIIFLNLLKLEENNKINDYYCFGFLWIICCIIFKKSNIFYIKNGNIDKISDACLIILKAFWINLLICISKIKNTLTFKNRSMKYNIEIRQSLWK